MSSGQAVRMFERVRGMLRVVQGRRTETDVDAGICVGEWLYDEPVN